MSEVKKIAGVSVPLFSLRKAGCCGAGDFGCLPLLTGLATALGLEQIYVQDVFDSVMDVDRGPVFPVCIDLAALPPLTNRSKAESYAARAAALDSESKVDYDAVYNLKMHHLRDLYLQEGARVLSSDDYHSFWRTNRSWLERYAAYCTLRHKYGTGNYRYWSEPAYEKMLEDANFIKEYSDDLRFHCYVQFLLSRQLESAVRYAAEAGITLVPCGTERAETEAVCLLQMEPWEAEEMVRERLHAGPYPVILPLEDYLSVTSLLRSGDGHAQVEAPADGGRRMTITLENILSHRALLDCIGKIVSDSINN